MSSLPLTAFAASLLAGLADVAGGCFALCSRFTQPWAGHFIAIGSGFLLGVTFFELLPDVLSGSAEAPFLVGLGYFTLLALEQLLPHPGPGQQAYQGGVLLAGLTAHAFLEGAAIAGSFLAGERAGLLVVLPLVLHKLPEGFGLAAVALASGCRKRHALAATGILGLATALGTVAGCFWAIDHPRGAGPFLALAAGTFLYIGTGSLVQPGGRTRLHLGLVLFGAAVIRVLSAVLHRAGLH
jgi:zinc transporter ZupT